MQHYRSGIPVLASKGDIWRRNVERPSELIPAGSNADRVRGSRFCNRALESGQVAHTHFAAFLLRDSAVIRGYLCGGVHRNQSESHCGQ
jgi:hypothetical protein